MSNFVDLHCHSTASDGSLSPADVVREAHRAGLSALSLTDHDTIAGCAEAQAEAKKLGIDFLPGIEISCRYPRPGLMHLLGYGIDATSSDFGSLTQRLINSRNERNQKIIDALRSLNVAITMEEVIGESGGGTIGRPHIAAVLIRKGYVSSVKQAFEKYLGPGGAAYFDKETFTPREAIDMIRDAGGVAVLAHAVQLKAENDAQLELAIKNLVDVGLQGLEVLHSDHDERMISLLESIAKKYSLLRTGGSDFHGRMKENISLGWARKRRIPREYFDALVGAAKRG